MSCHHVGEETDHEGKRFGEHTEELNHRHYGHGVRLKEKGHLGPEDFLPVFLVAEEVDGNHRAYGKEECDVDVSRHVGTTGEDWYEANHVGDEYEEEDGEEIGSILLVVLLAHRRTDEVVVDSHHEHLHSSDEPARSLALLVALLIPSCA